MGLTFPSFAFLGCTFAAVACGGTPGPDDGATDTPTDDGSGGAAVDDDGAGGEVGSADDSGGGSGGDSSSGGSGGDSSSGGGSPTGGSGGSGGGGSGGSSGGSGGGTGGGSGGGPACVGCSIDGACVAEGTVHEENPCEICAPGVDAGGWSVRPDGTACDDGFSCTGADRCDAGECVHAGPPCSSAQSCEEDAESLRCCDEGEEGEACGRCLLHVSAAEGSDSSSGGSWDEALQSVTAALELAAPIGCEVWVAAGTYRPDDAAPWDEAATFQLAPGVDLYGGFAGDETTLEERDIALHETILSGDLAGDDDPNDAATTAVNSRHVVTGADDALLDGFTISGGNADGDGVTLIVEDLCGGGLLNDGTSPTVRNCTFRDSIANYRGGAIYNSGDAAPEISDCTFEANQGQSGDAIANVSGSTPLIEHSTFVANGYRAIFNEESAGEIRECSFYDHGGCAVVNWTDSTPLIVDSTFEGNDCGIESQGAAPLVVGCTFTDNLGSVGNVDSNAEYVDCTFGGTGPGAWIYGGSTLFVDCSFFDNTNYYGVFGNGGGLSADDNAHVVIMNSRFENNDASFYAGAIGSFGGALVEVSGSTFIDNHAKFGGAIGIESAVVEVTNSTFYGNWADSGGGISVSGNYPGGAILKNTILWHDGISGNVLASYSDVYGQAGGTNIDLDPRLVQFGDDLHIQANSPCIDVGDAASLPADLGDLGGDGDVDEPVPLDLDGNPRSSGAGVDRRAYEFVAP